MELDDPHDLLFDFLTSGQYENVKEVILKNNMHWDLNHYIRPIVKSPAHLKWYLTYTKALHPEDFSTMMARCIEQSQEPWAEQSLIELVEWAKSHPEYPRFPLYLLNDGRYRINESFLSKAEGVGYTDPYYRGSTEPFPDVDIREIKPSARYRGFRFGYYIAKYGDVKAKKDLWLRWHAHCSCLGADKKPWDCLVSKSECHWDCCAEGVCLALGIKWEKFPPNSNRAKEIQRALGI